MLVAVAVAVAVVAVAVVVVVVVVVGRLLLDSRLVSSYWLRFVLTV